MRILQTQLPQDTGFPRWGCLNMGVVYGCEDLTGEKMEFKTLVDLIRLAQRTPVPWVDGKNVIDFNPHTNGFWNYNLDWWTREVLNCLDPDRWDGFPVGRGSVDGDEEWFADTSWWHRDYTKDFSFVLDRWGRPGGGGHYVYFNPHHGWAGNPDPTLVPLYWQPAHWKFLVRRR